MPSTKPALVAPLRKSGRWRCGSTTSVRYSVSYTIGTTCLSVSVLSFTVLILYHILCGLSIGNCKFKCKLSIKGISNYNKIYACVSACVSACVDHFSTLKRRGAGLGHS